MKFIQTIIFCLLIAFTLSEIEVDPLLTGGQVATLGQFPHHVLISRTRLGFTFWCSGSLIRYNWVVTSASCVNDFYSIRFQFGIVNRTAAATWETNIIEPTHVIIHQNFIAQNPSENNIALIFVENAQPSLLNSANIGVVALPVDASDFVGAQGTVSGFGWTNPTAGSGSNNLMFINVQVISNAACQTLIGSTLNETSLCTSTTNGMRTCNEDTGSGLVSTANQVITLIGIASIDECNLNRPSKFTRTSSFVAWINQTILQFTPTTTTSTTLGPTISTTEEPTTPSGSKRNLSSFGVLVFVIFIGNKI